MMNEVKSHFNPEQIKMELQCPVTGKPLFEAVTLFPCAHKINEVAALHIFGPMNECGSLTDERCPLCQSIVATYVPDHTIRNIVRQIFSYDESGKVAKVSRKHAREDSSEEVREKPSEEKREEGECCRDLKRARKEAPMESAANRPARQSGNAFVSRSSGGQIWTLQELKKKDLSSHVGVFRLSPSFLEQGSLSFASLVLENLFGRAMFQELRVYEDSTEVSVEAYLSPFWDKERVDQFFASHPEEHVKKCFSLVRNNYSIGELKSLEKGARYFQTNTPSEVRQLISFFLNNNFVPPEAEKFLRAFL